MVAKNVSFLYLLLSIIFLLDFTSKV